MSWEEEKREARKLLGQSLLSHIMQVAWQSLVLAAMWSLGDILIFKPHVFDIERAGETLIGAMICILFLRFISMLLAAGKLRRTK